MGSETTRQRRDIYIYGTGEGAKYGVFCCPPSSHKRKEDEMIKMTFEDYGWKDVKESGKEYGVPGFLLSLLFLSILRVGEVFSGRPKPPEEKL
jgi:hypothetical protein